MHLKYKKYKSTTTYFRNQFYIQNNMNLSCSKIECYHIVTLTEPIMLTGIENLT